MTGFFIKERSFLTDVSAHQVTFVRSDINILRTPEADSLLELAEEVGLQPDYGCRYGTGEACSARLIEGDVTHDEGIVLPDKQTIFLCSSTHVSDIRLDM